LKLAVSTNTSSTSELTAKKPASPMALKYTEPCTACAAWKKSRRTTMRNSAVPSETRGRGR
jgi:hypothetical protein